MRLALSVALLVAPAALAGDAVRFCVGSAHGKVDGCADTFAGLSSEQDGRLFAVDAIGNVADWGPFCSWRGVRVVAAGAELGPVACDEAKRRLNDAADSLTRAGIVAHPEWPRVFASALAVVVLHPVRVLEVPRGEEFVAGAYVPAARAIHLTATLEGAAHEMFHAVLATRGGSIDHDAFPPLVDALSRAARSRYRGRPAL